MGRTARGAARWLSPVHVQLDHVRLEDGDAAWLSPVQHLVLWAVQVPDGLLASLPALRLLEVRGGSGSTADVVAGCRQLRGLVLDQVRGLSDLTALSALEGLELLDLYGLPRVSAVPSLAGTTRLARVQLGSLQGLAGLTGVHEAPALEELYLARTVAVVPDDAARLAEHPTLRAVEWFGEDVPDRVWVPFLERVGKPPARAVHTADWFAARGGL